jgi:hypothetical protein
MNDIDNVTISSTSSLSRHETTTAMTMTLLDCKLKMLELLDKMTIKKKTIVDECKLLDIVSRWSLSSTLFELTYDDIDVTSDSFCTHDWIQNELLDKLVDKSMQISSQMTMTSTSMASMSNLALRLKVKANKMYDEWSNLKQSFKIPKIHRTEERIEHERELLNNNNNNNSNDAFSVKQQENASFNTNTFSERRLVTSGSGDGYHSMYSSSWVCTNI